ncbi:hypothetical protein GDO86_016535 [Hymenochirus boettgeri]|uniref:Uncharacterized protein n=1 Tax=Hymenochirus boettgeri TaxID=247094 RepID=A0A8T2K5R7_9PIPI|nr:hypothetical protein GDO86_016535 [Hymenochirus boettgeri]
MESTGVQSVAVVIVASICLMLLLLFCIIIGNLDLGTGVPLPLSKLKHLLRAHPCRTLKRQQLKKIFLPAILHFSTSPPVSVKSALQSTSQC